MKKAILAAAMGLAAAWAGALPAEACLTCGGGSSSASSDLGAAGGAAGLFSVGSKWMVQRGLSVRNITGSFNERGNWNPTPTGGTLQTVQGTLGLSYFPTMGASIGLQLPVLHNTLDKATWGPAGSVMPTDVGAQQGIAFGDVALQGTYKFFEAEAWALAAWGGANAPTGRSAGDAASLAGAGSWTGSGGLLGVGQFADWELIAQVGHQRALGPAPTEAALFYMDNAWLGQFRVSKGLTDAWRVGLAVSGLKGDWRYSGNNLDLATTKLRITPNVQYAFCATDGVSLALGYDPATLGANTMTDWSVYAVFYQFMN